MKFLRPESALRRQDSPEEGSQPASFPKKQGTGNDVVEQKEVDGGSIQGLQSASIQQPTGYSEESRHDGRRRAWLAYVVFALLAVLICGHYAVVVVFAWFGKSDIKSIEDAFNTSLPVIAGLAGTAAAFYFKDRDRGK
jgi:hypothetical protein